MNSPAHAIEVAALEKRYGPTSAVDGISFSIASRRGVRPARPERRGQDDDGRDPRGLPPRRRRRGAGARCRSVARRRAAAAADRRDAPGRRPLSRASSRSRRSSCSRPTTTTPTIPSACSRLVGLDESRHTLVRRMSGGQQQRLSLALALIGRPSLVFLDEPTAGMDPHARATTWTMIRELRDRGVTVVLTTHAMDEAEQLCDRVGIIDHGRLVACGSPTELTTHAAADETTFSTVERARRSTSSRRGSALAAERGARGARPATTSSTSAATPELVAALTTWLARAGVLAERAARRAALARGRVPPPHRRGARREGEGDPRPDADRDAAHPAPRREPARHAGDPARDPRVLLVGRRGEHHATRSRSTSSCPGCSRWR